MFGNYATRDLTYNARAQFWMPEGVFRYLSCKGNPGLVEAITVCFVSPKLDEPALLLGRLNYRNPDDLRAVCDAWDLWALFFD